MTPSLSAPLVLPERGYNSVLQAEQHIKTELLSLLLLCGVTPSKGEDSFTQVAGRFYLSGSQTPFQLRAISGEVYTLLGEIVERIVDSNASVDLPASAPLVCACTLALS